MNQPTPAFTFANLLVHNSLFAFARVEGNPSNPFLSGMIKFFETPFHGILVEAEVFGLPNESSPHTSRFYGFHIHEHGNCSNAFEDTGLHFNPANAPHPYHAGDFPPLLGNNGYAWCSFFDGRLTASEIIGKSVIIHAMADDFTTQPSGNPGEKIGCGVIYRV